MLVGNFLFSIAQLAKVLSTLATCAVGHLKNNTLGLVPVPENKECFDQQREGVVKLMS